MTGRFQNGRWTLRLAVIAGFLSILAFSGTAVAYAPRLALVSSDPSAESSVAHLPRTLELQFTETLVEAHVNLTDSAGRTIELGTPVIRNETVKVSVSVPDAAPGRYTVSYSTTSTLDRASHGSLSFTVTTGVKPSKGATKSPSPTPTQAVESTAPAAAPADFFSSNPGARLDAQLPEPRSAPPAWWTYAAAALVAACILVAFLGFSRRRIRPAPTQRVGSPSTANEAN
ncbi:copper resistance CopC family protein [Dactylosporangium sp. NPDC005572]|uniref:copper resistance CopC family protein n=1 Tax=Dactylosporangium sp. NPDC005572 TaxID=3156889 RepID=UPI0033AF2A87